MYKTEQSVASPLSCARLQAISQASARSVTIVDLSGNTSPAPCTSMLKSACPERNRRYAGFSQRKHQMTNFELRHSLVSAELNANMQTVQVDTLDLVIIKTRLERSKVPKERRLSACTRCESRTSHVNKVSWHLFKRATISVCTLDSVGRVRSPRQRDIRARAETVFPVPAKDPTR
jgi:hypothetical protein